jgi:hypothetical protein
LRYRLGFYIQKVDEIPKVQTADYLGDLTGELEEFGSGSYIEEFVSDGLKASRFQYFALREETVQQSIKLIMKIQTALLSGV